MSKVETKVETKANLEYRYKRLYDTNGVLATIGSKEAIIAIFENYKAMKSIREKLELIKD